MSNKPNDINELEHKRRIRAMLAGDWRTAAAGKPIVSETLSSESVADDIDGVGDTGGSSRAIVVAPAAAGELVGFNPGRRASPRDLMALYLLSCGVPKTRSTRLQGLQRCAAAIGKRAEEIPWHELRLEHTAAIRAALLTKGYRKPTIDGALWALKGILGYAEQLGFMSFDDYRRAAKLAAAPGDELPAGRALEEAEIAKLRDYCASEAGLYGRFLDAVFALLLGAGLRADEACMLPLVGYDRGARVVRLRRKGGKERELPIDRHGGECLDAWLVERKAWAARVASPALLLRAQKNDWINDRRPTLNVRALGYTLQCVAHDAGLAHFTPHDLRRTFCTRLLDAGVDLAIVVELMSHSDPKTTKRYDRRGAQAYAAARETVEIW